MGVGRPRGGVLRPWEWLGVSGGMVSCLDDGKGASGAAGSDSQGRCASCGRGGGRLGDVASADEVKATTEDDGGCAARLGSAGWCVWEVQHERTGLRRGRHGAPRVAARRAADPRRRRSAVAAPGGVLPAGAARLHCGGVRARQGGRPDPAVPRRPAGVRWRIAVADRRLLRRHRATRARAPARSADRGRSARRTQPCRTAHVRDQEQGLPPEGLHLSPRRRRDRIRRFVQPLEVGARQPHALGARERRRVELPHREEFGRGRLRGGDAWV